MEQGWGRYAAQHRNVVLNRLIAPQADKMVRARKISLLLPHVDILGLHLMHTITVHPHR